MNIFHSFLNLTVIKYFAFTFLLIFISTIVKSEENGTIHFALSNGSVPISYTLDGKPVGIFPELITILFENIPEYDVELKAFPWSRGQKQVEEGSSDAFCTYPSISRQEYAIFSRLALFQWDYGYLVYHKENKNRPVIEAATSFEDISELIFMSQQGIAWEEQNIPAFITREYAMTTEALFQNVLKRRIGDFFIMTPEEAVYLARKYNLQENMAIEKVNFIPNNLVPFQIGVSKKHPAAEDIIRLIDQAQLKNEFLIAKQKILQNYRMEF